MLKSAKYWKGNTFLKNFLKLNNVLSICVKYQLFGIHQSEVKKEPEGCVIFPSPRTSRRSKYLGGNRVKIVSKNIYSK